MTRIEKNRDDVVPADTSIVVGCFRSRRTVLDFRPTQQTTNPFECAYCARTFQQRARRPSYTLNIIITVRGRTRALKYGVRATASNFLLRLIEKCARAGRAPRALYMSSSSSSGDGEALCDSIRTRLVVGFFRIIFRRTYYREKLFEKYTISRRQ